MAPCDWIPAAHECRGLGVRVRQVSCIPRVPAAQPEYESVRVQVYLLYGMDPPSLGPIRWSLVRYPCRLLRCPEEGLHTHGMAPGWYRWLDWFPGLPRLVDGQVWSEG